MSDPTTPRHTQQLPQQPQQPSVEPSPSRSIPQTGPTAQQWAQATNMLSQLHGQLQSTTAELTELKKRAGNPQTAQAKAKINKPGPFSGKPFQVESWCAHMNSYARSQSPEEALDIAVSYLDGEAFPWWTAIGSKANILKWNELSENL